MHMDKIMILTTSKFERLVKNRVAQEMMVQNVSLEKDLAQKQADITYLQNQINPHFLYNTLECIRGQALNEGMDDLADTVKALALFFRYNISVKGTVVSFEEELKNLENYISIQQYRFKNKFTMHVDIEPEEKKQILACQLPKLCLQPLVENAILHAFNEITTGGRVTLKAFCTDGNLSIVVADNPRRTCGRGKGTRNRSPQCQQKNPTAVWEGIWPFCKKFFWHRNLCRGISSDENGAV